MLYDTLNLSPPSPHAGTDSAFVERLDKELGCILGVPGIASPPESQGPRPVAATTQALGLRLAAEVARWPAIVRAVGAPVD